MGLWALIRRAIPYQMETFVVWAFGSLLEDPFHFMHMAIISSFELIILLAVEPMHGQIRLLQCRSPLSPDGKVAVCNSYEDGT